MSPDSFVHYKTHIQFIDQSHWKILEIMNTINYNAKHGNCARCYELIDDLEVKLLDHFNEEEVMLEDSGYPYLAIHKSYHMQMICDLEKLKNLKKQKQIPYQECATYLHDVLVDHIDFHDGQYVEWLNKNGKLTG